MRIVQFVAVAVVSFSLNACSFFYANEDSLKVAEVGNSQLFETDIPEFLTQENSIDSITQRKLFVDNWVKEKLLLKKALENLTENQASFEKQLENYRNSLLIYTFENQIINQKLDTLVSNFELKKYYRENSINFKLRKDIVKAVFVATLNNAPDKDSLEFWMFGDLKYFEEDLIEFCSQFSIACHLDTSEWIPLAKIKEIGKLSVDKKLNLAGGRNIFEDSLSTMYINSFQTLEKGAIAPYSWVKNELKSILLNKRKIELIAKVKEEIFEAATLNKEYEVYE